jgi:hypothetical protein
VHASVRAHQDWRDAKSPQNVPQRDDDEEARAVALERCLIHEDQKAVAIDQLLHGALVEFRK